CHRSSLVLPLERPQQIPARHAPRRQAERLRALLRERDVAIHHRVHLGQRHLAAAIRSAGVEDGGARLHHLVPRRRRAHESNSSSAVSRRFAMRVSTRSEGFRFTPRSIIEMYASVTPTAFASRAWVHPAASRRSQSLCPSRPVALTGRRLTLG